MITYVHHDGGRSLSKRPKRDKSNQESMLEDRRIGVICSREPENEGSKKLITIDSSGEAIKFLKLKLVRNQWR